MPLLTKPESMNPHYKTDKIIEELKNIFKNIDMNKFLTSITKNARDKSEFREASVPVFKKILNDLRGKKVERNVKEFFDISLIGFAEFIANQILNYIKIESKTIEKDNTEKQIPVVVPVDGALEKLKEKFEEFQTEDGLKDILSLVVKELILEDIANLTHGFVGADLAALSKESAMVVLRKLLPELDLDKEIPKEKLEHLFITKDDFKEALKVVRPSALREVFVEIPDVKWEDIGGLNDVKQELKEAVEQMKSLSIKALDNAQQAKLN
jgi:SpoVK/Ycf46/Vps4 family AAA+-type ATPase